MSQALRKALEEIKKNIARKTNVKNQLEVEIAQLQATMIGLQNARGQAQQAEIAWTQLVRAVLNSNLGRAWSAAEVRDTLLSWGYTFQGIKNPLAFVNNILQRLAAQGQAVRSDEGRPFRFMTDRAKRHYRKRKEAKPT